MGLINWIFDFYQQYRIDQLQKETSQAAAVRGPKGGVDVERLERALGELALAVKTIQRTMIDKGVCTQQELYDRLKTLDLEDGRADGRLPLG
jgi:hypothetical protein